MIDSPLAAGALFALACILLLLVPFAPAWLEWRRPTDFAPLDIPANDGDNPMAQAESFRAEVDRMRLAGPSAGYEPVVEVDLLDADASAARAGLPVLACEPIRTSGGIDMRRPFYATRDLEFRAATAFRDVMTQGSLVLGAGSRICRWGHADGGMRLGERSVAARHLSARGPVHLERGCCFQRVHAPEVRFGREPAHPPAALGGVVPRRLDTLPGAVLRAPGQWRIEGDCSVPMGSVFAGSLVVTGMLTLGARSRVEGSVKAYRGIVVGEGATLTGAAVCIEAIHVLRDASVGGPLVSESHLLVRSGARLGRPDAPTTASAGGIVAEEGAVAHGTVWARTAGVVVEEMS